MTRFSKWLAGVLRRRANLLDPIDPIGQATMFQVMPTACGKCRQVVLWNADRSMVFTIPQEYLSHVAAQLAPPAVRILNPSAN